MRNAGAVKRREKEQDEPDPVEAAVAELGRVIAQSDATRRSLERHERAIAGGIARMERLAAECPNADRLAAAADKLSAALAQTAIELISDAAHNAEGREILERVEPQLGTIAMMREAWIAEGRRREAAERDAQLGAPRSRPARHRKHLRPVPSIPATAVRAAAAGIVAAGLTGGIVAGMHEESSVRTVAVAPAWHMGRPDTGRPDSAVRVPSSPPRAYVPRHAKRPSADAASASPAPSSPPPSSAPAPVPQPPVPSPAPSHVDFSGHLDLQTIAVVIGPSGAGTFTFTAVGGSVSWSASAPAGLSLSSRGGTLEDGQPEVITVTAQPGLSAGAGVITLTDGAGHSETVPVTWVAVPGLPV